MAWVGGRGAEVQASFLIAGSKLPTKIAEAL